MHDLCEFLGYPNVREAESEVERDALEARYRHAYALGQKNGYLDNLMRFEEDMHKTHVVLSMDIDSAYHFITKPNVLFSTYGLQFNRQIRIPAVEKVDRERRIVESMLFGSYGENIRYGVLSLDAIGVVSYGDFFIQLRDVAIMNRVSFLEDNSYRFVVSHKLKPGEVFPPGFRASWTHRHTLAVARLANSITKDTHKDEYANLLLNSEGNFATDRFIEAHVFGGFDAHAVESVHGYSARKNRQEESLLVAIKESLKKMGKTWVELGDGT